MMRKAIGVILVVAIMLCACGGNTDLPIIRNPDGTVAPANDNVILRNVSFIESETEDNTEDTMEETTEVVNVVHVTNDAHVDIANGVYLNITSVEYTGNSCAVSWQINNDSSKDIRISGMGLYYNDQLLNEVDNINTPIYKVGVKEFKHGITYFQTNGLIQEGYIFKVSIMYGLAKDVLFVW